MRKSGILLPVSALTGEYGIGDFGKGALHFIDFLRSTACSVWQILPITTIGMGNSPYSGVSTFGGNYLFVDLTAFPERWISQAELAALKYNGTPYRVNYAHAKWAKKEGLKLAFSRLNDDDRAELQSFAAQNADWLEDYAVYMALKETEGEGGWMHWPEKLRLRDPATLKAYRKQYADLIEFYRFEQMVFFKQWRALKRYANENGVEVFGDLPIYVAEDSVDVWAHPELFLLDKNLRPTKVAGVPPDYFAEDGQLWGNPLYDYKRMEKDGFAWFVRRIVHNLDLYDILRIDHFRGLHRYWAVPAGAATAKEGTWEAGPQMKLWKEVRKVAPNPRIVAEDLGIIDEGVVQYLADTGFPGMRVFQFAFDGFKENPHLPYNYIRNCVAYSATHDNTTTLGWLYELNPETRAEVLRYIDFDGNDWGTGGRNATAVKSIWRTLLSSVADTVIFPLQDLCAYGGDTRLNIPGVAEGNWEFRATLGTLEDVDVEFLRYLNVLYGRANGGIC